MFELAEQLKQVSTKQLESAVAESIGKAAGAKCAVSISAVDYESAQLSVEITMRLSEPFE